MCDKHDCKVCETDPEYVMFKCARCGLMYAVDRYFLKHVLKGVWPSWRAHDPGVRW